MIFNYAVTRGNRTIFDLEFFEASLLQLANFSLPTTFSASDLPLIEAEAAYRSGTAAAEAAIVFLDDSESGTVPEPTTTAIFILGIVAFGAIRRRRAA